MNKNRTENYVDGEITEAKLDATLQAKVNGVGLNHTHTLSQVTDAGDSAGLDVGTGAGTVAAGDHAHTGVYLTPVENATVVSGSPYVTHATMICPTEAPYYASGSAVTTTTVGSTAAGTSVTVASGSSFSANQGIYIAGAGAAGADYVGTVSVVASNTLTITPATSTTVPEGTLVMHDDSAAIQAAVTALATTGGTIILPDGTYNLNGPLQDTDGANCVIKVPDNPWFSTILPSAVDDAAMGLPITITGTTAPPMMQNYMGGGGTIVSTNGVILQTRHTSGAVIGGRGTGNTYNNFTWVILAVRNLTMRSYENPAVTMLNANKITSLTAENLNFDTAPAAIPIEPTNANGIAINAPAVTNSGDVRLRDVNISGYYTGVRFSEHTILDNIHVFSCLWPFEAVGDGGYGSYATRLQANGCPHALRATGSLIRKLTVEQLYVEHQTAPAWAATIDDIYDPSNLLRGSITYDTSGSLRIGITGGANCSIQKLDAPSIFTPPGNYNCIIMPVTFPQTGQVLQAVGPVSTVADSTYAMQTAWRGWFSENLLPTNFADAAKWIPSDASVTANSTAVITPDHAYTGYKLVEGSGAGAAHYIRGHVTTLEAGSHYTFTVIARAGERSQLHLYTTPSNAGALFDLSAVTATPIGTIASSSITALANSWYKCSVTFTAPVSTVDLRVWLGSGGAGNYNGNGTSGLYIKRPQLVYGDVIQFFAPEDPTGVAYLNTANVFTTGQTINEATTTPKVTTAGTSFIAEQTGDTLGTTRLTLQNRSGMNGVVLENASLDLADMHFLTSTASKFGIRYEHRTGAIPNGAGGGNNGTGEFQMGVVGDPSFITGAGTTAVRTGKFGIGYLSPTYALMVAPSAGQTAGQTVFIQDATATTGKTGIVVKEGAGNVAGDKILQLQNATGTVLAYIAGDGTIVSNVAAAGVVLKDTQATPHYWRVTVSNTGVLGTTDLGTTAP